MSQSNSTPRWLVAGFLALPPVAALALRLSMASSRPMAMVLLLEPLFVAAALYVGFLIFTQRRHSLALALTGGSILALTALHLPARDSTLPEMLPWPLDMGRCLEALDPPQVPVRLMIWHVGSLTPQQLATAAQTIDAMQPDALVLSGPAAGPLVDTLADTMGGEAKLVPDKHGTLAIRVRGAFQYCGAQGQDEWAQPLASLTPEDGQALLTLPHIDGIGVFPLLAFEAPMDLGRTGRSTWPRPQQRMAAAIAALAPVMGESLVACGHLAVPPSLTPISGWFKAANLTDGGGPATWPRRLANIWSLPYLRMEYVLTGSLWSMERLGTVPGDTAHRPLLAILQPDLAAMH